MTAHDEALRLLKENRETLDRIATALLDREILDGEELDMLVKGENTSSQEVAQTADPVNARFLFREEKRRDK